MDKEGKIVIFSAPSGAGKTTIVKHLLTNNDLRLEFSVSATSRPKREGEVHGTDYYFLSAEEFREKIAKEEFLEWEEVYDGQFYGTLKSELERIWKKNKVILFDIDVKGGINIKTKYPKQSLAIFVEPPNIAELERRLRKRSTESETSLRKRVEKAAYELTFSDKFDKVLVNDELETALQEAEMLVKRFINS